MKLKCGRGAHPGTGRAFRSPEVFSMMLRLRAALSAAALASFLLFGALDASAEPTVGEKAPDARVEDVDGRSVDVKALKGKPLILFYEGKDSSDQNEALKSELSRLRKAGAIQSTLRITAVADVSDYAYWPVKGIVKDKIREESSRRGMSIYCDWDGSFRAKFKLRRGVSNVILLGEDGRVLFAHAGEVKGAAKSALLAHLQGGASRTSSP
jgi:hypothetical protein